MGSATKDPQKAKVRISGRKGFHVLIGKVNGLHLSPVASLVVGSSCRSVSQRILKDMPLTDDNGDKRDN